MTPENYPMVLWRGN